MSWACGMQSSNQAMLMDEGMGMNGSLTGAIFLRAIMTCLFATRHPNKKPTPKTQKSKRKTQKEKKG
jgi:hypothetical protein